LQTGATVKNDHHIFAQGTRLIFLTLSQTFAGCHHEDNRNDPPSDAEHGEECAQLVRPQCPEYITN